MIQFECLMLAKSACIDQSMGTLSLFECLTAVTFPRVPVTLSHLAIGFIFRTSLEGSIEVRLYLKHSGRSLLVGKSVLQVYGKRMPGVLRLENFPLRAFGEHKFIVTCYQGEQRLARRHASLQVEKKDH